MKKSVSLITLGVSDYQQANAFYAALGWKPVLEIEETAFFQADDGLAADGSVILPAEGPCACRTARREAKSGAASPAGSRSTASGEPGSSRPALLPADGFAGVVGSVRV